MAAAEIASTIHLLSKFPQDGIAASAYQAHVASTGKNHFHGGSMPPWSDPPEAALGPTHEGKTMTIKMESTVHPLSKVPWNDIAASAYRAYAASTGNKNFRGDPMPAWSDLPEAIQTAWQAAVRQAVSVSEGGSYGLDIEDRWKGWRAPGLADSVAAEEVQL